VKFLGILFRPDARWLLPLMVPIELISPIGPAYFTGRSVIAIDAGHVILGSCSAWRSARMLIGCCPLLFTIR